MIISAPASSANIGPGFDALSIALDVDFLIALNEQPKGCRGSLLMIHILQSLRTGMLEEKLRWSEFGLKRDFLMLAEWAFLEQVE